LLGALLICTFWDTDFVVKEHARSSLIFTITAVLSLCTLVGGANAQGQDFYNSPERFPGQQPVQYPRTSPGPAIVPGAQPYVPLQQRVAPPQYPQRQYSPGQYQPQGFAQPQPQPQPARPPVQPPQARPPYQQQPYQQQPNQQTPVQQVRSRQQVPSAQLFTPGQIIAKVGNQTILAGDMLGSINQMLAPYEGKAPEAELEAQRELLMKQMLAVAIETKLVYHDFIKDVPSERFPDIEKAMRKAFLSQRLPDLLDRAKVNSAAELDTKLREYGSSLEKTERVFMEQVLAQQHIRKVSDEDPEVTHQDMLTYYRDYREDFLIPAKARWERLSARFAKFRTKEEAYRSIVYQGNQVVGGAAFKEVAKKNSSGPNASEGGFHDWTTKGSLASTEIDNAIFSLPVGKLSQIIETKSGFHIIRVIERNDEDVVSFVDAQPQIKEKITTKKATERRAEYIEKLRRETYVWTVFDADKDRTAGEDRGTPRF